MDDLEQQLRRTLRGSRRDVDFAADPLPAVHEGMRRRVRRRSAAMAATAVLLVVAAGTAIGNFNRGRDIDEPPVSPSITTSAVPTPQVSATASAPVIVTPSPAPTASAGTSAASATDSPSTTPRTPALGITGFAAEDLSFVSATKGWTIGAGQCGGGKGCTAILGTTNGGATWQRLGSPTAPITPEGAMCAEVCVDQLRFANSDVGYLFGGTPFMTVDGGATWTKTGGEKVYALEPAGGDVIRVIATTDGCPPGCAFVVERSVVGATKWTRLTTPALGGVGARLLRQGDDVFVFADQHTAGGAGGAQTQIIVSHDRGATWTARPDPCSPPSQDDPNESDAVGAATGADGTLVLLCRRRDGAASTLRISSDAGSTFGAAVAIPASATGRLGVGSANAIVVSSVRAGKAELLLTTDGGATFRSVVSVPQPDGDTDSFLAFTTDLVGTWTGPSRNAFWWTTDGGATWVKRPFG